MGIRQDIISQAKKENWRFNFRKSSLGPLIETLGGKGLNAVAVAKAVSELPDAKRRKYKKTLALLQKNIPPLGELVEAHKNGVGLTDQTYAKGKQIRMVDVDNRWYEFEIQEEGNSCGCAAVRSVVSQFTHIKLPSEEEIRDQMSLYQSGIAHQGFTKSNHDWENIGSVLPSLVSMLLSLGVPNARAVHGPGDTVLQAL